MNIDDLLISGTAARNFNHGILIMRGSRIILYSSNRSPENEEKTTNKRAPAGNHSIGADMESIEDHRSKVMTKTWSFTAPRRGAGYDIDEDDHNSWRRCGAALISACVYSALGDDSRPLRNPPHALLASENPPACTAPAASLEASANVWFYFSLSPVPAQRFV